jgi:hypothetical protein
MAVPVFRFSTHTYLSSAFLHELKQQVDAYALAFQPPEL